MYGLGKRVISEELGSFDVRRYQGSGFWGVFLLLSLLLGAGVVGGTNFRACGEDPRGDVCRGVWNLLNPGEEECRDVVNRPAVDLVEAHTDEEGGKVVFSLRVAGRAEKSMRVAYGFRGVVGKGILGTPKHLTAWAVDGVAYLWIDPPRQLLPVKVPMGATFEDGEVSIRISKLDLRECTQWEMAAFAVEAESQLGPAAFKATANHDGLQLGPCPVPEPMMPAAFAGIVLVGLFLLLDRG